MYIYAYTYVYQYKMQPNSYVLTFCITFQEKSTQSRYLGIWKLNNGRAYEDDSRNGGIGHHCNGDGASYGNECIG